MVECSGVAPEETSSHFHAAFKFLFALKATELPPWLPFCMSSFLDGTYSILIVPLDMSESAHFVLHSKERKGNYHL